MRAGGSTSHSNQLAKLSNWTQQRQRRSGWRRTADEPVRLFMRAGGSTSQSNNLQVEQLDAAAERRSGPRRTADDL